MAHAMRWVVGWSVRTCRRTLLLIALGLVGACNNSGTRGDGADGRLVLTGSSSIAPLAAEIGKRFEAKNPGVRVDVQTGGSSRGVSDVRTGTANIGMVSRALGPDEADLRAVTIALDGVSIIVHAENGVRELTDTQVGQIFTGKVQNWSAVGGKDAPITVVNKAEGRSTLELFLHHFKLKAKDIRAHVVIGDNEQGIKTVAANRNAIGYVSIGTAEHDARSGTPIRLLPVGGIMASAVAVQTGKFPLSRPLNLVIRSEPRGPLKAFLDYASSREVHDLVEAQNFVPAQQATAAR